MSTLCPRRRLSLCALILASLTAFAGFGTIVTAAPSGKSTEAASRAGFEVRVQGVRQDRIFSVDFQGSRGIAVGGNGVVFVTEDDGRTWQQEAAPVEVALFGVAFRGEHILAVGQSGTVVLREGWGGAWREIDTPTRARLLNVSMNARGSAVAVGSFGLVLCSEDYGQQWRECAPDWKAVAEAAGFAGDRTGASDEPTLFTVRVLEDGQAFIAGELSYLLRSDAAQRNWSLSSVETQSGITPPTLHDLTVNATSGIGYAVGQQGSVFKSSDGGASWLRQNTGLGDVNLLSIAQSERHGLVAVGMRVAAHSQDQGETWQELKDIDFSTQWYSQIVPAGDAGLVAVGHSGRIVTLR